LGADLSKGFVVSGDSAGANLAAVVAHDAVDSKLSPPITGVHLRIPLLVHPDAVPEQYKQHYNSWEGYKDGLILDQKGMRWFYGKSAALRKGSELIAWSRPVQTGPGVWPREPPYLAERPQEPAAHLFPDLRVSTTSHSRQ
jgi:acetyl esterase/lipase